MTRSICPLATFLALWSPAFAWADWTFSSYALDSNYKTTVTNEALKASPPWKDSDENPPLSAHQARRLADKVRAKLVKDTTDYTWRLSSIELTPSYVEGRWYWLVNYTAHFNGAVSSGIPPFLKVVVLMDGTVAEQVPFKRRD